MILLSALACAALSAAAAAALRVDDGGSGGLPVVFVHGNGGNGTQWKAQLAHLRASRRAVAIDLHGMGESAPAPDGDYSVDSFADDVAAVVDALGIKRFVLVGHSYGGFVVAAYAGKHPERLAGLVFADCAGDLSKTPPADLEGLRRGLEPDRYEEFTRRWFAGILAGGTDETKAAVMRSLAATPRETFIGATFGLYAFPMSDALARYGGPRLSIASFLLTNPAAVHKTLLGLPVEAIRGASHWLMMDCPGEFNRILDAFLARIA
ncbi:MAG TPA: alpha/beta hydrolase [Thermoanaerobaculia bacterium]|nr:alpha/beta hydrolase [Thermoanaerobaculia bacterium]